MALAGCSTPPPAAAQTLEVRIEAEDSAWGGPLARMASNAAGSWPFAAPGPVTVLPSHSPFRIVCQALQGAVADLARRFGANLAAWRYGDARLHHARIAHVLDPLVTDSLRRWLSLGPVPRGGNGNTLNATGNGDNQTSGPSFRVVIDLANWDAAIATNTPGQSGDPRSPWYANLFPLWGTGRYVPLPYSPGAVRARAAEVVTLRP